MTRGWKKFCGKPKIRRKVAVTSTFQQRFPTGSGLKYHAKQPARRWTLKNQAKEW
jgi:hypothetical protein